MQKYSFFLNNLKSSALNGQKNVSLQGI